MANKFARHLRKNMTETERFVWTRIRYRQIGGFKFRRQAPLGRYIVDFVCFEARLVLELDGGQHADQAEYDTERTRWLESQGFQVFRLWNFEVLEDWGTVAEAVAQLLPPTRLAAAPHADHPHKGGGEDSC